MIRPGILLAACLTLGAAVHGAEAPAPLKPILKIPAPAPLKPQTLAFSRDGKVLALGLEDGRILFWEVPSGKPVPEMAAGAKSWDMSPPKPEALDAARLPVLDGSAGVPKLKAISPDGCLLAAALEDGTVLVWSLPEDAWEALAAPDASRAIRDLAADPVQAVTLLKAHLKPVALDPARIAKLIADLDSDAFAVRDAASAELEGMGGLAEPALKAAVASESASFEVRTRAQSLLDALQKPTPVPQGEALRTRRCIQLLGLLRTPEAVDLLKVMASGSEGAFETCEAKTALAKLGIK